MTTDRIRNKQYTLSDLQPGDRFYFAGDKKKKLYTLNDEKPFEIKKQAGFHIKYANCQTDATGSGRELFSFKANRQVIFIRNVHEQNQNHDIL